MVDESDLIFEIDDYEGTPVVLSQATWHSKAGNDESGDHPEIRGYLEEIADAIRNPDLVFQSTRDERSRIFYRLNVGRGEFAGKNVVVIVKYVSEQQGVRGYVSTIYLSRSVYSRGARLWPRGASLLL